MQPLGSFNVDWDHWKSYLSQAVEFAEEIGVSKDKINSLAYQAGDILAGGIAPSNPEQKVLKELWDVSDQQEKQVIANLMVKLCSK